MTTSNNLQDLALFMIKSCLPHWIVKIIWLQCLTLQVCPWMVFLSKKTFTKQILAKLVENTKKNCMYYLPWKNACWQQLLVFGCQWVPTTPLHLLSISFMHIGSPNTIHFRVIWSNQNKCQTMALKLQALLNKFGLKRKCILMSKMKTYKVSQSKEDFEGYYELWKLKIRGAFSKRVFGHVMSKVCQYGTTNNKVRVGSHNIYVKLA